MKYIITGTSSGLGFSLAQRLVNYGHVIGVSRSLGKADSLVGNFTFIKYDLSETEHQSQYDDLLLNLRAAISDDLFTLVFNAASFYSSPHRLSASSLAKLFAINLFSTMNLIRDLQDKNLRRILFINSISGIIGHMFQHEYAASKHALMGYARSLSQSAKYLEYDVMSINPGGMSTELWADYENIDRSDFLWPETVADICITLLSIPQRAFIENMSIMPPSDVRAS